jgi:hypothetical protein
MIRFDSIRRFTAAAVIGAGFAAAFASAAAAQDWGGPRVVGTGENASVEYATPSQNIVGGATYRGVGSGESATLEVIAVEHAIPGRLTRTIGSGESLEIVDIVPAPPRFVAVGQRG